MAGFGRDPALVASDRAPAGLAPSGFDPAYEAWRQALIAFYEMDELPMKARQLKAGAPLDYMDRRTIKALQAAVEAAQ